MATYYQDAIDDLGAARDGVVALDRFRAHVRSRLQSLGRGGQAEVARISGVTESTVSEIATGRHGTATLDLLERVWRGCDSYDADRTDCEHHRQPAAS